jgi:hypothetical protein
MAKYRITIEFTTRLSDEVEAASTAEVEQLAAAIYQEWDQGNDTHVIGAEHHRSLGFFAQPPKKVYSRI